jgi:putative transposase
MLKAIKVRLYPTKDQINYINNLMGSYRFVFNHCLELKKNKYLEDNKNLGLTELGQYFHQILTKNTEYEWIKQHNTKVLKQSIINLLDSYKNFFINGNGYPKFKSKHNNLQSCRFPVDAISVENDYNSNRLTLIKQLKNIKFKCSEKYKQYLTKHKKNIKSATLVKKRSGGYYLSILIDGEISNKLPNSNKILGIDLGIKDFIVDSNGCRYENIKIIRKNEEQLKKLQRQLDKKQKDSNNRNKARIKLAKFYQKLTNKKENYLHYISNKLLNENQIIVIEDLNIKGMMKNHNLAKSISELSLGKFISMLEYKAKWYGRTIIKIDRFFASSKTCSCCGYKNNKLKLSQRNWTCNNCNTKLDRDLNAAKNILNEGIKIINDKIPIRDGKYTLGEIISVDQLSNNVDNILSMNQEIKFLINDDTKQRN